MLQVPVGSPGTSRDWGPPFIKQWGIQERRGICSLHCVTLEPNIYIMGRKLERPSRLPFILQPFTVASL